MRKHIQTFSTTERLVQAAKFGVTDSRKPAIHDTGLVVLLFSAAILVEDNLIIMEVEHWSCVTDWKPCSWLHFCQWQLYEGKCIAVKLFFVAINEAEAVAVLSRLWRPTSLSVWPVTFFVLRFRTPFHFSFLTVVFLTEWFAYFLPDDTKCQFYLIVL